MAQNSVQEYCWPLLSQIPRYLCLFVFPLHIALTNNVISSKSALICVEEHPSSRISAIVRKIQPVLNVGIKGLIF